MAKEMPRPRVMEMPQISIERLVKRLLATRLMPLMAIMEKTTMVAPPTTQLGMVESSPASLGQKAAAIRVRAPVPMTQREHTLVIATMPEHWL